MASPKSSLTPYTLADWSLVPGRTALIGIDLQNDVLSEDGWYAQSGVDIAHMRRVIQPTVQLIEEARSKHIPIIWTRHGFRDARDGGVLFRLRPFLKDGGFRVGTWGWQVYEAFKVEEQDWFVDKNRLSAFYNTNLEVILRGLGAETIIFTGVLTNQCVAATSKDASFRDYKSIVVEECTGTTLPELHEPTLKMVKVGWGEVKTLKEMLGEIKNLPAGW